MVVVFVYTNTIHSYGAVVEEVVEEVVVMMVMVIVVMMEVMVW